MWHIDIHQRVMNVSLVPSNSPATENKGQPQSEAVLGNDYFKPIQLA